MKHDSNRKSLTYYLFFTFLLTFGTGFIIYISGGLEQYPAIAPFIMFFPAIVAIIVTTTVERKRGFLSLFKALGFRLGKIKYIILYPMFIFMIIVLIYQATYLIAPDVFVPRSELTNVLSELEFELGSSSVYLQIAIIFFLNSGLGPIINIPLMLGEEVGWRAFLYPRLEIRYGKSGMIIGGIIWGIWHAPMIIMGLNYPSAPFSGIFMMVLVCVPMGIILYYFYVRSGSIITVALCHGVINQTASTINMIFVDDKAIQPMIHGPTGIIGIIVFAFIAFILYKKHTMENYNQLVFS